MSKKYITMAAGWLKENKSGEQYVSAVSGGEKSKTKLFLQLVQKVIF